MEKRFAVSIRERGPFVDTSAFLALVARNDSRHLQAVRLLDRLRVGRNLLYTTKYVVYESHAAVLADAGGGAARQFLLAMANSATRIMRVRGMDEARAREIIFKFADKEYSLCDATSFAVMERLGLRLAFTFDDHFTQHGFSTPLDRGDWP